MTFRYSELKLKATILKEFGYKKQPKFPVYHKFFERDGLYISQSLSVHDILYLKVLTPILADLDFKNREKLKKAVRA